MGNWQRGRTLIASSFLSGAALLLVALLPFYAIALGLMVAAWAWAMPVGAH